MHSTVLHVPILLIIAFLTAVSFASPLQGFRTSIYRQNEKRGIQPVETFPLPPPPPINTTSTNDPTSSSPSSQVAGFRCYGSGEVMSDVEFFDSTVNCCIEFAGLRIKRGWYISKEVQSGKKGVRVVCELGSRNKELFVEWFQCLWLMSKVPDVCSWRNGYLRLSRGGEAEYWVNDMVVNTRVDPNSR